ncbi:MAG TPA: hypothetical protein H9867_10060 [Candidatus Corynebacterium gallistercoris]|uniref:Uncharacterized protein n=1 Tax=Candidatus Corynebacterium gallistercoris TaxID=2838530 RepID=A0A9D1S223_9CORY|nr:hypothetical protein [Candidatus Corynebacterium gallistercoris]
MSEQYKQAYARIVEEYFTQLAAATMEFERTLQEQTEELKKLGVTLELDKEAADAPMTKAPQPGQNGRGLQVFDR